MKTKFTKWGDLFEQVARAGQWAVFRRSPKVGRHHYELIKVQSHNGYSVQGKQIEASECFPPSTSWGTYGFTGTSLKDLLATIRTRVNLHDRIELERILIDSEGQDTAERSKRLTVTAASNSRESSTQPLAGCANSFL